MQMQISNTTKPRGLRNLTIALIIIAVLAVAEPFSLWFVIFEPGSRDIRDRVFTTNNSEQMKGAVINSTTLSDADKRRFQVELQRAGYQPYGKTVQTILNDGLADEVRNRGRDSVVAGQLPTNAKNDQERPDLDTINTKITDVSERVSDLNLYLTAFAIVLTVVGIAAGVIIGLIAYFTAQQRAESSAKEWMEKNTNDLVKQFNEHVSKALEAAEEAKSRAQLATEAAEKAMADSQLKHDDFVSWLDKHKDDVQKSLNAYSSQVTLQSQVQTGGDTSSPAAPQQVQLAVSQGDGQGLDTTLSAEDLAARGFEAYASGNYESSAGFFKKAGLVEGTPPGQAALFRLNAAVILGQLGRYDEALAAFDDVVASYKDDDDPTVREQVAKALTNKGVALAQMWRPDDAIATYNDVIARYQIATEEPMRETVSLALFNKALAFGQTGRIDESIATYDEIVARYQDAKEAILREQVARALLNKGIMLTQQGNFELAIVAYDALEARFKDATEPNLREQVARALTNKGYLLSQQQRFQEAVATYDVVATRYKDATEPNIRVQVAYSLVNEGDAQRELGRFEDALATYKTTYSEFENATDPNLRKVVAGAFNNSAYTLGLMGHWDEEVKICDQAIALFKLDTDPKIRTSVVHIMSNKGEALAMVGKYTDALEDLNEALDQYPNNEDPDFSRALAWVTFKKAVTLGHLNRGAEARSVFGELTTSFGDSTNAEIRKLAAKASEYRDAPQDTWQYPNPSWFA
jgi:tetratricopeptide (TPR) repeat protein